MTKATVDGEYPVVSDSATITAKASLSAAPGTRVPIEPATNTARADAIEPVVYDS